MNQNSDEKRIEQIFVELEKSAKKNYPQLLEQLRTFGDTKVALQYYEEYMAMLNQQPTLTSSNQVNY